VPSRRTAASVIGIRDCRVKGRMNKHVERLNGMGKPKMVSFESLVTWDNKLKLGVNS
jgi:hypothetical protein